MDIDMTALRLVEHERDISLDVLVSAIEQALLSAYHRTPGAHEDARVEVDRRTGHVTVWAREEAEPVEAVEGEPAPVAAPRPEFVHTPEGFGRVATATARQVIVQRLRDAEDEQVLGAFRGTEGELLAGIIQQGRDPRTVLVAVRGTEAVLPHHEQVPTEQYVHGERLRAYVAAENFQIGGGNSIRVTASVGVSTLERGDDTPDTIYKRADNALYAAKRRGRNRVAADAA